jgi:hypothetical protein
MQRQLAGHERRAAPGETREERCQQECDDDRAHVDEAPTVAKAAGCRKGERRALIDFLQP